VRTGILNKATETKIKTEEAQEKEGVQLAVAICQIEDSEYKNLNKIDLQNAINNQLGEKIAIVIDNGDNNFIVSCINSKRDYIITSNGIEKMIDWNKIFDLAIPQNINQNTVYAVDKDGKNVDMTLWYYSFDNTTNGYALNKSETLNGSEKTAGYRGKIINGEIIGNIPQYIKENNGDWIPVTSLYRTFQGDDSTNTEILKLAVAPIIPNTVESMKMTFENCSNLVIVQFIPGSVKTMRWTFDGNCTSLEKMPMIGYGVKDMTGAFAGCTNLRSTTVIPDSVENLCNTFNGCTLLEKAPEIPKNAINLNATFANCTNLVASPSIIPEKVENIIQTFASCTKLTGSIIIDSTPTNYINCFQNTSTGIDDKIVVNYTANCKNIDVILSNSYNTNAKKGQLIEI